LNQHSDSYFDCEADLRFPDSDYEVAEKPETRTAQFKLQTRYIVRSISSQSVSLYFLLQDALRRKTRRELSHISSSTTSLNLKQNTLARLFPFLRRSDPFPASLIKGSFIKEEGGKLASEEGFLMGFESFDGRAAESDAPFLWAQKRAGHLGPPR
jgi:hypothetical protein